MSAARARSAATSISTPRITRATASSSTSATTTAGSSTRTRSTSSRGSRTCGCRTRGVPEAPARTRARPARARAADGARDQSALALGRRGFHRGLPHAQARPGRRRADGGLDHLHVGRAAGRRIDVAPAAHARHAPPTAPTWNGIRGRWTSRSRARSASALTGKDSQLDEAIRTLLKKLGRRSDETTWIREVRKFAVQRCEARGARSDVQQPRILEPRALVNSHYVAVQSPRSRAHRASRRRALRRERRATLAPKPSIQLRSAQSFDTSSVSLTRPSGSSSSCCESCQTRPRTNGATRASNSSSTRSGVAREHAHRRAEQIVGQLARLAERLVRAPTAFRCDRPRTSGTRRTPAPTRSDRRRPARARSGTAATAYAFARLLRAEKYRISTTRRSRAASNSRRVTSMSRAGLTAARAARLRRDHLRQRREELAHPRIERALDLRERRAQLVGQRPARTGPRRPIG